jgi:hypothetical protein
LIGKIMGGNPAFRGARVPVHRLAELVPSRRRRGGNVVTGLAIGAAALLVMPFLRPIARPLAKAAIKGGILAYRETARLYSSTTNAA